MLLLSKYKHLIIEYKYFKVSWKSLHFVNLKKFIE